MGMSNFESAKMLEMDDRLEALEDLMMKALNVDNKADESPSMDDLQAKP